MNEDLLVYPGGAVKDLGGDKVGGHLIVWGGPDHPDMSDDRDFFTPETELYLDEAGEGRTVALYKHGLDPEIGPLYLGDFALKSDKVGLWWQGQLAIRQQYMKKYAKHLATIKQGIKDGSLGLSSGAAFHLIEKERQPNGTHWVKSWRIAEGSFTPEPADGRALARSIKSLTDYRKSLNLGPDVGPSLASATLERLADMARWRIADALRDSKQTAEAKLAAVKGCLEEQASIGLKVVETCLAADPDPQAIKSLLTQYGTGDPLEPFVAACLRAASDLRLSASQFAKIGPGKADALKSLRDALDDLLAAHAPPPKPDLAEDLRLTNELLARLG